LLNLKTRFLTKATQMGEDPGPLPYTEIDSNLWYVVEVGVYIGGVGVTGCARPYVGTIHDICWGGDLKDWLKYDRDCTGWILIWGYGDAQRLLKIFGPYDDMGDAQDHNW